MKRLILLGSPGSGKGTQAVRLQDKYNIPSISTGDIFRENLSKGTELGKKAKSYMDAGELVPDDLVNDLVEDRLNQEDCLNGFILDGFPRTVEQAEALDKMLEKHDVTLDNAILISVPNEILIKRITGRRLCRGCGSIHNVSQFDKDIELKCTECGGELYQRSDDNEETAYNRIKVYDKQTKPLINFYDRRGLLIKVKGDNDADQTFEKIVESLGE